MKPSSLLRVQKNTFETSTGKVASKPMENETPGPKAAIPTEQSSSLEGDGLDFRQLFEAIPGLFLALLPDSPVFTIVAASDAYLRASKRTRAGVMGLGLFQAFQEGPDPAHSSTLQNLRASFERVLGTRQPDSMALQRYDLPRLDTEGGGMEERFWSPVNSPVLNGRGEVTYILHRVEDVTEFVRFKRIEAERGALLGEAAIAAEKMEAELILRSRQLAQSQQIVRERERAEQQLTRSLSELSEANATLKLAHAAAGLGAWTWDVGSGHVAWSEELRHLLQMPLDAEAGFETWVRLIHPGDRDWVVEEISQAIQGDGPLDVTYRIVRPDGATRWLLTRGQSTAGRMVGLHIDVTERREMEEALRSTTAKLALITEASRSLLASPVSSDVLPNLLTLAHKMLPADAYAVWRDAAASDGRWQLVGSLGLSDAYSRVSYEPTSKTFPPELFAYEDLFAHEFFSHRWEAFRREGIRGMMCVPLRIHDQPTATLVFYYRSIHTFLEAERTVATALGNLASAALTTAELYDRQAALRQEAEAAEAQFRLMADSAPVLIWVADTTKECTWFNRPWLEFRGRTQEQERGFGWAEGVHPDDYKQCVTTYTHRFDKRESFVMDYRLLRHDGEWRWMLDRCVPRLNPDGSFAGYIGSCVDISERKQAEEALRESEESYRFLAESMPQMVWTTTPGGELNYVSGQVLEFFGRSREALLGAGWLECVHAGDRDRVVERWKRSLGTGEPYEMEFQIRRASDQAWRWFLVRAVSMQGPEGLVRCWVGTCTDIHDRKESEAALRLANRELEEFAYVASHDLQEPLRIVNIYTQLILLNIPDATGLLGGYAKFVRSGVLRMERLIKDVLTFSRNIQPEELPAEPVDLAASLAEALEALKESIEECGAIVTAGALPAVRGDQAQLAHVFQNLLANALKYRKTCQPPEIHISASRDGEEAIVVMEDNGIGFDPQYAVLIFGLFKRLHSDGYPGTGLGLAICQRIIERYGGRMWAEGVPGRGAKFYFALRLAAEALVQDGRDRYAAP